MNPLLISGAAIGGMWLLGDTVSKAKMANLGGGQRAALTSLTIGDQSQTSVLERIKNLPHDTKVQQDDVLSALIAAARAGIAAPDQPYLSLDAYNATFGAQFGGPSTDLDSKIAAASSALIGGGVDFLSTGDDASWGAALDLASAMDSDADAARWRAAGPVADLAHQVGAGIFDFFGGWQTVAIFVVIGLAGFYVVTHGVPL